MKSRLSVISMIPAGLTWVGLELNVGKKNQKKKTMQWEKVVTLIKVASSFWGK